MLFLRHILAQLFDEALGDQCYSHANFLSNFDMKNSRRHLELLAPAKNADFGIEAIRHGADAVYIGRGSNWGNPYVIGRDGSRALVIARFRAYAERRLLENPNLLDRDQWIKKLAQCHWSFEDVRSGRCWAHMRQYVKPSDLSSK